MKIIPDKKYPNFYRVQWPNGDVSITTPTPGKEWTKTEQFHYGFYNKARALEFLKRSGIESYKRGVTYRPSGIFVEGAEEEMLTMSEASYQLLVMYLIFGELIAICMTLTPTFRVQRYSGYIVFVTYLVVGFWPLFLFATWMQRTLDKGRR